jgi:hypothetical protein
MVNLTELAARLNDAGIMTKSFLNMTRPEIETLISAVFSCLDDAVPPEGWRNPYLETLTEGKQRLVVPFDAHPKYHWWQPEGQCVLTTLYEIEAPYEVFRQYAPGMSEEEWQKKLIPF